MKTYEIAYVDVTCLNSIEEAIEHSCEIHKHYSGSVFGMLEFQYMSPDTTRNFTRIVDENEFNKAPEEYPIISKTTINIYPYDNKLKEYKDFYSCFTDRLMPMEISVFDFNTLHEFINRQDDDSKDNFPSPRLRELVSSITDSLLASSYDYFTGIKIFSLKNEIIAFVDHPVIKPMVEAFNPHTGNAVYAWGFYLKSPSHCLRLRAVKS